MKTILSPTDFSKPSDEAVNYAAKVANLFQAKLVLLHVFIIPITIGEGQIVQPIWADMEKDCMNALEKKKRTLISKYETRLQIDCIYKTGYSIEEIIKECIKENKVDLVVMGMHGAGYLSEKLIGSVTTTLIRKSDCPVLVIKEKVKFKGLKKIVLAIDFENSLNNTVLNPLKQFVELFNSQVFVLNVVGKDQKLPSIKNVVGNERIEHNLGEIKHSYYFIKNDDIITGINKFAVDKKANLIVIIPHNHNFLSSIFQERNTKKMAFHTSIPLLALHD